MATFLHDITVNPRARVARGAVIALMLGLSASACPFPTQFPEADPIPNSPPVIDPVNTTPYYDGGNLSLSEKPMLTIWVDEPDLGDTLYVKVIKNLADSIAEDSEIPPIVLKSGVEITDTDVPPPEEGWPETVRMKQFELQVTPCPLTEPNTTPVLTVCVSDTGFRTYDDTNDPCLPKGRDADPKDRGYTVRYDIVYSCGDS